MTDVPPSTAAPEPAPQTIPAAPAAVVPSAPVTGKLGGLAIASLIVGGVAFLFGLVPYFGILLALSAIVLAVIAIVKKQIPRWMPFVGGGAALVALLTGVIIAAVLGAGLRTTTSAPIVTQPQVEETSAAAEATEPEPEPTPEGPQLTMGQDQAVKKAESYLAFQSFSRTGLIDQLEFEGFSTEDATFAVDYLAVDWNDQAAKKAESYLEFQSFSRQGLVDQLIFEGFSQAEAEYGVTAVGY